MNEHTPDPGELGRKGDRGDRGAQGERGDRGDRGPHGDRGDKGDEGETKLIGTAEQMVARLVKADRTRKLQVRLLGTVCAALIAVFIILGAWVLPGLRNETAQNAQYTNSVVQHECRALELLVKVPVQKPGDPAANPSREATYLFYLAIVYWEHSDGCDGLNGVK